MISSDLLMCLIFVLFPKILGRGITVWTWRALSLIYIQICHWSSSIKRFTQWGLVRSMAYGLNYFRWIRLQIGLDSVIVHSWLCNKPQYLDPTKEDLQNASVDLLNYDWIQVAMSRRRPSFHYASMDLQQYSDRIQVSTPPNGHSCPNLIMQ